MSDANSSVAYLQSLRARDIMSKEVIWANSEDSVQTTFATMNRCRADDVLLRSADKLEDIVFRSDFLGTVSPFLRSQFCRYCRLSDDASLRIKIRRVASRPLYAAQPDTAVRVVMEKMCRYGGKCLPVVDETDDVHGLLLISRKPDRDLKTYPSAPVCFCQSLKTECDVALSGTYRVLPFFVISPRLVSMARAKSTSRHSILKVSPRRIPV